MGLFEPQDDESVRLTELVCGGDDAGLRVFVDERLLGVPYLRDGCLLFNVEGFGRFRLYVSREP